MNILTRVGCAVSLGRVMTLQCLDGCNFAYTGGSPGTWKVALRPASFGGEYQISVSCTGCGSTTAEPIVMERVTFGQVWVCSGQVRLDPSATAVLRLDCEARFISLYWANHTAHPRLVVLILYTDRTYADRTIAVYRI